MPASKRPPRGLSAEERALWRQVTETVLPLAPQLRAVMQDALADMPPPRNRSRAVFIPSGSAPAPLIRGCKGVIDGSTAERFRKGKLAIDHTIDLHGMTRERAFAYVREAIHTGAARGARVLRIITGKGRGEGEGILRAELPKWLNLEDIRPLVLAFDFAPVALGGEGAYLVLLKRERKRR